jgi:hypothetical protein
VSQWAAHGGGRVTHPENSAVAFGLLVPSEVPGADRHGGDDLAAGEDELRGPVPTEEQVEECVALVAAVLHGAVLCRHPSGLDFVHLDGTGGGEIERVDHPGHEEQHDGDALEDGHEDDDGHRGQGASSFFDDANGEEDPLAKDADETRVQSCEDEADDTQRLHRRHLSLGASVRVRPFDGEGVEKDGADEQQEEDP